MTKTTKTTIGVSAAGFVVAAMAAFGFASTAYATTGAEEVASAAIVSVSGAAGILAE